MNSLIRASADDPPAAQLRARAISLFEKSDYAGALAACEGYLSQSPQDTGILNYKARALEGLGRLDEALRSIDDALRERPEDIAELSNRAVLLTRLSRGEEALRTLDQVLTLDPGHIPTLIRRAYLLFQLGRSADALASAERAVREDPTDLQALNTRGMILDDLGHRAQAFSDFQRILAIEPNHAPAITNCGVQHGRAGKFQEALACYERSLAIDPHQPSAFYNRAVVRLVLGDWRRGFPEFESRWSLFPHEASRLTRLAPRWTGEADLAGKTILLHHEQGYGDTLQFARYVPLVTQRGATVVLAVPASLKRLMATLPGSPRIVSEGEPVPPHDFHCPLMSLPLAFGTTPSSVPIPAPYLRPDPQDLVRWSERLGPRRRLRIGVVWCGRRFPPINYARDMRLDALRPLFALDADFVCLQTDLSELERAQWSSFSNGLLLGEKFADFADTAALMGNLDLIITVDTAIAHLAGALGKPVWVMNRYATCWRWLLERSDSPWYPTLRLFRQPSLGDWGAVVRDVLLAAASYVLEHAAPEASPADPLSSKPPGLPDLAALLQGALDQHNAGDFEAAIQSYRHILGSFPGQFDALHYLGVALAQLNRFDEALEPLAKARTLRPTNATVQNHLGNVLAGLSRHREALECYERAIDCDAGLAESHYNRGVALMALGQSEEAVACHTEASRLNPLHAQAYNNRGVVLSDMGRLEEALADYERASEARPEFVDAWVNRSDALRRLRRFEEALNSCARALELDSHRAEAHNSRGAILADVGRQEDALRSYDQALTINPSSAEAVWNKGLVQLSRGNLREGWTCYESRWGVKSLKLVKRFAHLPPWQGAQSIAGRRVLLHAEQGYGDTIQFSRYCAPLAALGAQVILSAPKDLHGLFKTLQGVDTVVEQSAEAEFDVHCPLMSVPLALGTELDSIPAPLGYLKADPAAVARWATRLKTGRAPKIGLVWSGRVTHAKDPERSVPLKRLLPLFKLPARWISLQKEIRASDVADLASAPGILRLGEELTDFADTAGLIECLDLLITVDTAVAHLAGALGKPVWILLPYVADWRWLQEREDSPWYPSARLFRQVTWGDWAPVIDRIRREFAALRAGARK